MPKRCLALAVSACLICLPSVTHTTAAPRAESGKPARTPTAEVAGARKKPSDNPKPPAPTTDNAPAQSLGAVRPSNLVIPQMGVSSFGGDSQGPGLAQIVQNDLELADVAVRPRNQQAAQAAAVRDQEAGDINPDGWAASGVMYVLRGSLNGDTAQAELYDVASKRRIMGNSYNGFAQKGARRLAHKIADDIITALTNQPGIFSSQICYLAGRGGGQREIMVMDADGASAQQLTNEGAIVATPCRGKNGTEVYFTSYRDNNPDLYGVTLGGRRFEISRRPGLNTSPSWNEATQRLAISLSKDGNSELYTMSRDGRDLARLTNAPEADTAPDFSPDGSQIAFTSDRGGTPQIYVMSSSGGEATRISGCGYCDSPAWSPDGRRIAYVVREGGEFNIYVADITSGGPAVQLTRGQRDNTDPSWAPDSKHLVFSSTRGGSPEIYMMNTDVKIAHPLTRGGNCTAPSWGPPHK